MYAKIKKNSLFPKYFYLFIFMHNNRQGSNRRSRRQLSQRRSRRPRCRASRRHNLSSPLSPSLLQLKFFNSQAPARKSNPQAPVSPCAAISLKDRSHSSKISFKVFGGAENHELTLKCEIYLRNSRKLHNSISIFL